MELEVCKDQVNDIRAVQDVARTSWASTYKGIVPEHIQDAFLSNAYSDEIMEKRLEHSLLLVARMDEQVVGFANFFHVNKEGQSELSAIYLYDTYQDQGVGSLLLNEGIQSLSGVKEIYVDVEKDNTIGKTFYERKGFQIVKEYDDNFNGHILRTVRMVLEV